MAALKYIPLLLLGLLVIANISIAGNGTISGRVLDPSGSPIPNANITIFGTPRGTATDPDGTYTVSGLSAGEYTVEFSATGYEDATVENVAVTAGQTTEGVDAQMTPST